MDPGCCRPPGRLARASSQARPTWRLAKKPVWVPRYKRVRAISMTTRSIPATTTRVTAFQLQLAVAFATTVVVVVERMFALLRALVSTRESPNEIIETVARKQPFSQSQKYHPGGWGTRKIGPTPPFLAIPAIYGADCTDRHRTLSAACLWRILVRRWIG